MLLAPKTPPFEQKPEEAECRPSLGAETACEDDRVREAAFFYAHLREELESTVERLCEAIARDVLARELQLGGADLARVVDRALAEYASLEPLRVRVCAAQSGKLGGVLPVSVDDALHPGDAVLELRTGVIDLRLATRLDNVVRAART